MSKIEEPNIHALCEKAFPGGEWTVISGKSGMNNTTRYVETSRGKYVLRIYETHRDRDKVEIEHDILKQLGGIPRPFLVPQPYEVDGSTVLTVDGTDHIASLSTYIPGDNPVFDHESTVYSFGQVTGELMTAFESVQLDRPAIYPPYYEIEKAHSSCPPEKVIAFCEAPGGAFQSYHSGLKLVKEQMETIMRWLPKLRDFPHQFIHGDLNASNVLTEDGNHIHAVLDFEFATRDIRVMEFAVAISELTAKETNQTVFWDMVHCFIQGFSGRKKLTRDELDAVPILMKLRRLDVMIHFLGRYIDGIDEPAVIEGILDSTIVSFQAPQAYGAKWERCIRSVTS